MRLSVIIVSYNVKHFLEFAIRSAIWAMRNISGEIIVIDNSSTDGSADFIRTEFPDLQLIESKENLGFSKANNIGISQSKGEYILLMNPDTIVPQNAFSQCIEFLDVHREAGALGLKMIDGSGKVLPESKRGFPTPWVSFCKMSGLGKLFPNSNLFNGYYLGNRSYDDFQEVDVLSGAFMMLRRNIFKEEQVLDERFFMYGEDIDLSYRIQLAGFKNYYLPEPVIIHFKGESTKKSSLNHIKTFHNAMLLFAEKYSDRTGSVLGSWLLKLAVWLKGLSTVLFRAVDRVKWLVMDILFLVSGFYFSKLAWSHFYFKNPYYYQSYTVWTGAVIFAFSWIISLFYNGAYEKSKHSGQLVNAVISAFVLHIFFYALMPEAWRFSRAIMLLSFAWMTIYLFLSRGLFSYFSTSNRFFKTKKRILVNGPEGKLNEIANAVSQANHIASSEITRSEKLNYKQDLLPDQIHKIDEVFFYPSGEFLKNIIQFMEDHQDQMNFRFVSEDMKIIIGSDSKNIKSDLSSLLFSYRLDQKIYKRQKRLFDVVFSLFLLFFSLPLLLVVENKKHFFHNVGSVIFGRKTWVSCTLANMKLSSWPKFRPGIIDLKNTFPEYLSEENLMQLIDNYYRNYSIWLDLDICIRNVKRLGNE